MVVCPTLAVAETLTRDLEFFLAGQNNGGSPVRLFPAYEVSPYQELDPPPEVTSRRLSVLWELIAAEEPLLVVTSAVAASSRLCPPEHLLDNYLELSKGQRLERDALVEALAAGRLHPGAPGGAGGRLRGARFGGGLLTAPCWTSRCAWSSSATRWRASGASTRETSAPSSPCPRPPSSPVCPLTSPARRPSGRCKRLRKLAREEGLSTRRLAELVEKIELRAPFTGLESLLPMYFQNAGDIFSYLPSEAWFYVVLEPAEVDSRLKATRAAELNAPVRGGPRGGPGGAEPAHAQAHFRSRWRSAPETPGPTCMCRALAMGLDEQEQEAPLVQA